MGRTVGSNGLRTAAAIRRAGLKLIHKYGFEAMTLRALAAEVGIQPASLYNHIATKQDLLFDLIHEHMESLLAEMDAALAAAPPDPVYRLEAFVACHLLYHMERKQEVFLANFELRALDPANYQKIVGMRHNYEHRLIDILDAGLAAGQFAIPETQVAAYAILAMLTGACTWYRPDGKLTKAEVVAVHTRMIFEGVRQISRHHV